MIELYYYFILLSAAVSFAAAAAVFWRNRFQAVGPLLGSAVLVLGLWSIGFAQYFRPQSPTSALEWAKVTLTAAILFVPLFFHGLCALVERQKTFRFWIVACYLSVSFFLLVIWHGHLVAGLKHSTYMDHYVEYNRKIYPIFMLEIVFWQSFSAAIVCHAAWKSVGYKRTQMFYIILAWFVAFLTINSILLPLEYDINLPPVGFFLLPLNFALLAYVLGKARLADYNVVVARTLLHVVTLFVVAGVSLLFIGGMTLFAPKFMNSQQILFTLTLVVVIGFGLSAGLPRLLPRAERVMQERLFGREYSYQDALAGLAKDLGRLSTVDQVLGTVAAQLHTQMSLTRVIIYFQDPLSGKFRVHAQSGMNAEDSSELDLGEQAVLVKHLQQTKGMLVWDEVSQRLPQQLREALDEDLKRLGVRVCIPMLQDENLIGMLCVGEKANRDMFFGNDLGLLQNLSAEVALSVRYRRMEDEVFRKNRLVELGTIAAGVAHEIRNPLASIKTFAQLMPEQMDDPEFKNEFSKLVLKDVDRIAKVIESMLAFARPAQVTIADHLANELMEEAILLTKPRFKGKRIELTREFHGNPMIKVDRHQILQVLVNLLSNAADALQEQGKVRVATGISQGDITGNGDRTKKYAVIEVSDSGPGIPAVVRNRLFDPFFTTKKEGTGLGLSISQKIVRDHGGVITVSSVEGKGTSFQVNLPAP